MFPFPSLLTSHTKHNRVFSDGGNFCPEEIETYKAKLETIAIKVDKCEGTVMSDLEGIEAKRLDQATKIVAEFEDRLVVDILKDCVISFMMLGVLVRFLYICMFTHSSIYVCIIKYGINYYHYFSIVYR